ncbi:CRNS1 synthase, partial [Penelope pileata]|nr:CRNS1 synthase [Penelope pileata]
LPCPSPPGSAALQPPTALRICTVLCCSWGEQPRLCQAACALGRAEAPVRHGAALPLSLDSALQLRGLGDAGQRRAVAERLQEHAEAAMAAVMAAEAELSPEQRGGAHARTDVLGVDFLLTAAGDALELVAMSTNCGRCLETCALLEAMGRDVGQPPGDMARLVAECLLHRAQRHLVRGCDVLLVGAGGVGKSFVWEAAREYGLRVSGAGS